MPMATRLFRRRCFDLFAFVVLRAIVLRHSVLYLTNIRRATFAAVCRHFTPSDACFRYVSPRMLPHFTPRLLIFH